MNVSEKEPSVKSIFLSNIPNVLTISRIVLTFVVMYMIFNDSNIIAIVVVFSVAALTDWFDGRLARRYNWVSEFGRKGDMIADRFLWIGTALAFVITLGIEDQLNWIHGVQLLLLMTREVISAPFALIAFFSGNAVPNARYIAKVTTFIQGFALPAVIISVFNPWFFFLSVPLVIATAITGFISAMYYLNDIEIIERKNNPKKKASKTH